MIEQTMNDILDELRVIVNEVREIRHHQEAMLKGMPANLPEEIPAGPKETAPTVPPAAPTVTPPSGPEIVDLSGMPQAPPQAGINGAEPPMPTPPPSSMISKEQLWEMMTRTYQALQQTNRGTEVGDILAEHGAQHIDSVKPEHYPSIYEKLQAKLKEVSQ